METEKIKTLRKRIRYLLNARKYFARRGFQGVANKVNYDMCKARHELGILTGNPTWVMPEFFNILEDLA